jgi:hypothetical protein
METVHPVPVVSPLSVKVTGKVPGGIGVKLMDWPASVPLTVTVPDDGEST